MRVTIGVARGSYPGEPTSQSTSIEMVDVTRPEQVTLDRHSLRARGGSGPGWSYDAATETLTVHVGSRPVAQTASVVAVGSTSITRPEPAAASSAS